MALKLRSNPQFPPQRPNVPPTRPRLNIRALSNWEDVPSRTLSVVRLDESSSSELTLPCVIGTTMTASAPPTPCVAVVLELSSFVIDVVPAAARLTLLHSPVGLGQTVTVFPDVSDTIAEDTR